MPTPEIYISTDVETDGPMPGPHSMLSPPMVRPAPPHPHRPRRRHRAGRAVLQQAEGELGPGGPGCAVV